MFNLSHFKRHGVLISLIEITDLITTVIVFPFNIEANNNSVWLYIGDQYILGSFT